MDNALALLCTRRPESVKGALRLLSRSSAADWSDALVAELAEAYRCNDLTARQLASLVAGHADERLSPFLTALLAEDDFTCQELLLNGAPRWAADVPAMRPVVQQLLQRATTGAWPWLALLARIQLARAFDPAGWEAVAQGVLDADRARPGGMRLEVEERLTPSEVEIVNRWLGAAPLRPVIRRP